MFHKAKQPTIMPARTLTGQTVGPVLDTGVVLPNGGRVYLSEMEIGECVRHFPDVATRYCDDVGWLTPERAQALRDEILLLQEQLVTAQAAQPRVVAIDEVKREMATA